MNIIGFFIQVAFVIVFLCLLGLHALMAFAAKRAEGQTTIPIPQFARTLMIINLILILGSTIYIILVRP
jgi:hypothetical protein